MNKSFKTVVEFYKPVVKLTHQQDVTRFYRKCLRNIFSWSEDRDTFCREATKIRAEFDANKLHEPTSALTSRLLREGKERLAEFAHPDPYIAPYMPGGSLFMRNSAPPLDVVFPDGIPDGVSSRQLNVDMSNIPDEQTYADRVFVDSISKQYWIDR